MSSTEQVDTPGGQDPDLVGTILADRYAIRKKLGEGGMGTVYAAEHVVLHKVVAIKVLQPRFANNRESMARFLLEAQSASKIRHKHVVDIIDFGEVPGGLVYFAMEFLEGEELGDLLRREGRLPWSRGRDILLQVVRGLGAAHASGIIHRDVKPENCFLVKDDEEPGDFIKVLDFGLAKLTENDAATAQGLTKTGLVMGTAAYMSPEQAFGDRIDERSDVYATAILAYRMLAGRVPFTGNNPMHVLSHHLHTVAPSPRLLEASIPEAVEAIILKALQKDPNQRFQNMTELREALEAVPPSAVATTPPPSGPMPEALKPAHYASSGGVAAATEPAVPQPAPSTLAWDASKPRSRWPWIAAAVGGSAVLSAMLVFVLLVRDDGTPSEELPVVAAAESPRAKAPPTKPPDGPESSVEPSPQAGPNPNPPPVAAAPPPNEPAKQAGQQAAPEAPPASAEASGEAKPRDARQRPEQSRKQRTRRTRTRKKKPKRTDAAISQKVKRRAQRACKDKAFTGLRLSVDYLVLSSGKVSLARAKPPHERTALGRCVANIVRKADFTEGESRRKTLVIQF